MDFSFTPEQEAIRETARQFAKSRLAPQYRQREQQGRLEPGFGELNAATAAGREILQPTIDRTPGSA